MRSTRTFCRTTQAEREHNARDEFRVVGICLAIASLFLFVNPASSAVIIRSADLGNSRYHQIRSDLFTDGLTWTEAEEFAVSLGGHLVTINDQAEQDWIVDTFPLLSSSTLLRPSSFFFWIGLNDANVEGVFEWVSGEPVTFTNFAPGEPNDFGAGEDYVYFQNFSARNFTWNDLGNVRLEQPGFPITALVEIAIPEVNTVPLMSLVTLALASFGLRRHMRAKCTRPPGKLNAAFHAYSPR